MARAHFTKAVVRRVSGAPADGTVELFENGTNTPLTQSAYADDTTTTPLANPFPFTNGLIDFYLPNPQRIRVVITPTSSAAQTFDNIDVEEPAGTTVSTAGGSVILASAPSVIPLRIKLAASQTAAALEVRDNADASLLAVGPTGIVTSTVGLSVSGKTGVAHALTVPLNHADVIGLNVKTAASPTAPAIQVKDSADVSRARVMGTGTIELNPVTAQRGMTIYGAASGIGNLLVVQTGAGHIASAFEVHDSAGTTKYRINNEGRTLIAPDGSAAVSNAGLEVHAVNTSNPSLAIKLLTSQVSDPITVANPGGTGSIMRLLPNGELVLDRRYGPTTGAQSGPLLSVIRKDNDTGPFYEGSTATTGVQYRVASNGSVEMIGSGAALSITTATRNGALYLNTDFATQTAGSARLAPANAGDSIVVYGLPNQTASPFEIRAASPTADALALIRVLDAGGGVEFQVNQIHTYVRRGLRLNYSGTPASEGQSGILFASSGQLRYLRGDGSNYYITG